MFNCKLSILLFLLFFLVLKVLVHLNVFNPRLDRQRTSGGLIQISDEIIEHSCNYCELKSPDD